MYNAIILLVLGDFLLMYSAWFAAGWLRFGFEWEKLPNLLQTHPLEVLILAFCAVFFSYIGAMYKRNELLRRREILIRNIIIGSLVFLAASEAAYLSKSVEFDRAHLLFTVSFFIPLQFLWHCRCHHVFELAGIRYRAVVIGDSELASQVAELMKEDYRGHNFVGFVTNGDTPGVVEGPVVGDIDHIEEIVRQHSVNMIVVALAERRGALPVRKLLKCKLKGTIITDSISYIEKVTGKLMLEHMSPSWFVFSDGARMTPTVRIVRRLIDIALSTVGILVALPIMPLVALAVKLDSPGPVIFKQLRVGEGDKNFHIYKFRTMRQNAESKTGAVWSTVGDPRITRIGKFLRKTRLDELPQLFNVMKGDMSFVGPRPERPEFVTVLEQQVPYYGNRHYIKPGVTGWAQVRYPYGASVEDALAKLRYDLYYIKNYSVAMDLAIVLDTVRVVLFGRGGR